MKTILTPIDFSSVSEAVVEEACALARALNGRVVLLSVVQPVIPVYEYAAVVENIAEITAAGEKHAARQLAALEDKLEADFITVDTVSVTGAPIPSIVDHANKLGADYIVMGSHGHTALYDLLVGSTTHGVLMRARCPVVIVPAPKEKKVAKAKPAAKRGK